LYFLCCITDEFDELRDTLLQFLGNDVIVDAPAIWPPKKEFRFRDLIAANPKEIRHRVKARIETLAEQRIAMKRAGQLNRELKAEFGLILDDVPAQAPNAGDTALTGMHIAPSEDKFVGRGFVENDAAKFIEAHSSPPCGTLSIIDIDDLTKINKVYTRTVGDQVIQIIGMLAEDAVKGLHHKTGRCGDDTFFIALANEDEDTTIQ
ncbi:diguanylate cyclase domain-containing protein, partial [Limnospira sp. PMC 289.06]|uniref:diguanylate cyclase domain-containing protein n=1 Tax=Limnospira sp. PMC 289.06 TaxID=2981094 RepID=UPI0028E11D2C|nr:diguanylate cyclase [Limnospira sp. PMC 289.06]